MTLHDVHPARQLDLPLEGRERDFARFLFEHGVTSRGELVEALHVSWATATRVLQLLGERGLVERVGTAQVTTGRPSERLDLVADAAHAIGIKVTATAVHGVRTDLRSRPRAFASRGLSDRGVAAVVDVIAQTVDDLRDPRSEIVPIRIGVAVGADVHDGARVDSDRYLAWGPVDLAQLVARTTGRPVTVSNDVAALTAHLLLEVDQKIEDFAVITIGAGVGYGLVRGRSPVGPGWSASMLEHLELRGPSAHPCPEGHRTCATALLATPPESAVSHHGAPRPAPSGDGFLDALAQLITVVADTTLVPHVELSGESVSQIGLSSGPLLDAVAARRPRSAPPLSIHATPSDFSEWALGAATVAVRAGLLGLD